MHFCLILYAVVIFTQQTQGLPAAAQNGSVAHLAPLQMGVLTSAGAPMMNGHNGNNQYTQAGGAAPHLQPMSAPPMINSNGQSPFFTPPTSSGMWKGGVGFNSY